MSDYLSKPVDVDDLLEKIRFYLPNEIDQQDLKRPLKLVGQSSSPGDIFNNENPVWEKQSALKRINQNHNLLNRLIGIYKKDTPNLIKSIQEALQQQDKDALKNAAHALKGISENISAMQMAEACRFLEKHHDEINDEPVSQVVSELEDYYLVLVKALSA